MPQDAATEETYIARCRSGDASAFAPLVSPFRQALSAYLGRMKCAHLQAEHMLQETLTSAWNGLPRYRHTGTFRAWLFRIAHNTAMDAIVRARTREHLWIEGLFGEERGLGPTRTCCTRIYHRPLTGR